MISSVSGYVSAVSEVEGSAHLGLSGRYDVISSDLHTLTSTATDNPGFAHWQFCFSYSLCLARTHCTHHIVNLHRQRHAHSSAHPDFLPHSLPAPLCPALCAHTGTGTDTSRTIAHILMCAPKELLGGPVRGNLPKVTVLYLQQAVYSCLFHLTCIRKIYYSDTDACLPYSKAQPQLCTNIFIAEATDWSLP